ncbi:MAG: hormogonium polysaccharide biosynthesis glycosyltransferase HpsE [Oscillatoria sp. PMC 1051.18]|uniref:hormogonium polysaccharide biosynthesis glycosyltransferase HpsE n=1 Tax=Oscillatoria salina TaxID=331517 RepID=UPI0013BE3085|nr:hormogonium polysaccharide biosynthesis glycosyltransferase HpsE [Oscillatoria salina]MBZ8182198.1 glycosyltransferase family 2 protein [Oscillatoria salina IIICB1]MEC4893994.1 hormogonium polysaccharide biosynthesis glycosyltransferase HpsE [Oscillatoria sp. PMC 1050.18]MEC5033185.1 hormogonium polysaccharide biosynthesis glycosyltransferase HpsE [Oscillatoria sp. PMC 1051.18]NET89063.1 glycosyltransferase family 2 protein [Kamptonema sp. SIO1D9]
MIDFSVVIPTYNGEKRLPEVLEKLQQQTNTENISWEIIVINNNSNDRTSQIVKDYQSNWNYQFPLRSYFEAKQGLTFARQRAIKEANSNLIGFLDDDNLPDKNWVAAAHSFGIKYPQAGAYSGKILGKFEIEPPKDIEKISRCLAIGEHGSQPHKFDPDNLKLPPGAGLVIRKQAWSESIPTQLMLIGRVGKVAVAGEDYEALLHLHKLGWEIWYNPEMQIEHKVPRSRLEKTYLIPLARSCGLPICYLRTINAKNWQKPLILVRTLLGNLRRLIKHWLKYRNQLDSDLVAAFELEFFWGSMMSPFYYLKKIISHQISS